ncbi:RALF-like 33 protein [Nymphaea thermarum]|nr:RALF-like 33 protein [Nymphaea thermarum]
MAFSRVSLTLLLLAMAVAAMAYTEPTSVGLARSDLGLEEPACSGSAGECLDEDEEDDQMTSALEFNGRMLYDPQNGYMNFISYAALRRNMVPCSIRGRSYYGCRRSGRSNPYRRGCSMITHCARILN